MFTIVLGITVVVLNINTALCWDYMHQGVDWTISKDSTWQCLAATSTKQSPIDIITTDAAGSAALPTFYIEPFGIYTASKVEHSTTAIKVTHMGDASLYTLLLGDVPYLLRDYTIRARSEHYVHGQQQDLEIQYAFENSLNSTAMVAFLLSSSADSQIEIPLLRTLSESELDNKTQITFETADPTYDALESLFAMPNKIFTYEGSSTEPPCEENVRWFVLTIPIAADEMYLESIGDKLRYAGTNGNYRALPTENLISGIALQKYDTYTTGFTSGAASMSLEVSFVATVLFAMAW